jgi:hypothetical protein
VLFHKFELITANNAERKAEAVQSSIPSKVTSFNIEYNVQSKTTINPENTAPNYFFSK